MESVCTEKFKIILPLTTIYIVICRDGTILGLYISYFNTVYHVCAARYDGSPKILIFPNLMKCFYMLISIFKSNLALWNIKNGFASIINELSSTWNMLCSIFVIIGKMPLSFRNDLTYRFACLYNRVEGCTYTCVVISFKLLSYIIDDTLLINISIFSRYITSKAFKQRYPNLRFCHSVQTF